MRTKSEVKNSLTHNTFLLSMRQFGENKSLPMRKKLPTEIKTANRKPGIMFI